MPRIEFANIEDRLISSLLPAQADRNPDLPWILRGNEQYTFGQRNDLVDAYAAGFKDLGIRQGDIVALMLESSVEYVFFMLALTKIGAVQLVVNTNYKGEFLRRFFDHAQPRGLVVGGEYCHRVAEVLGEATAIEVVVVHGEPNESLDVKRVIASTDILYQGESCEAAPMSHGDTMTIMYTSGTTGPSKGVLLSHNYWFLGSEAMAEARGVKDDDVFYSCTPLFHAGAWSLNIYPALIYGRPVGLDPTFSPKTFLSRVRHYGATQVFTIGAMHMWLWAQDNEPGDRETPVRVWSPIPLPDYLWEPFKDRYGLEAVFSAYGQTEAQPQTMASPSQPNKPGSAGWAQPNLEIEIFDDRDLPVLPNVVGEIVLRPKTPYSMFSGYHRDPEATLAAFANLWYHTGDLGRLDEDGELFFVDRKQDYLRRRGENISSFEVEAVVLSHPAIAQAAVHGVPSEDSEDEVKVCVIIGEGEQLTELELAEYLGENLPHFVVPRYIEIMDELPVTPTGRIQKHELRARGVTRQTWDAAAAGWTPQR